MSRAKQEAIAAGYYDLLPEEEEVDAYFNFFCEQCDRALTTRGHCWSCDELGISHEDRNAPSS